MVFGGTSTRFAAATATFFGGAITVSFTFVSRADQSHVLPRAKDR